MDLISVDQQSCNQDGLCAAVCPAGLITFEKDTIPGTIEGAEEICIACGHCIAICPTGSLRHRDMDVETCPPVVKEQQITADQCEQFLKSRRSIRVYRKEPVSKKTLERLLDVARYAPSGHNSQGVKWLVLSNLKELSHLSEIVAEWMVFMLEKMPEFALSMHLDRTLERWKEGTDVILRGAPVVVIAYGDKESRLAPTSCTIALTYLELAAAGMGLGCCWAGYFNAAAISFPKMKQALGLADDQQTFGAMMVGYPKFQYKRIPARQVQEISWRF